MPINGALLSVLDRRRPELCSPSATRASYTHVDFKVPKVTFSLGWELEANIRAARVPEGVDLISDGSVNDDSAEYIVRPTLVKSARYVLGLLKDLVHSPKLNTDKSCGFHVHLAPRNVSLTVMRKWALICQMLAQRVEAAAFKAVPDSRGDNSFCRPIRPLQVGTRFAAAKYGNDLRYQWFNIVEMFRPSGIRTVEVRLLGNTHRWKYVSAWALFCLQLGNEAWKVLHNPLGIEKSIECLTFLLTKIADEIKPLDKSSEPIPPWVYAGLNLLGIDTKVWDKPLAEVAKTEYELRGLTPVIYSDRQPASERARRNNDEDDNRCVCGCGEDGRCLDQIHNDGDCNSNECYRCCENGDCLGTPRCYNCQDRAHWNLEYCGSPT